MYSVTDMVRKRPNTVKEKGLENYAALRYNSIVTGAGTRDASLMQAYRSGHNEAVLKTVWVKAHGGSNPSACANKAANNRISRKENLAACFLGA